jgi:hypothetical protein
LLSSIRAVRPFGEHIWMTPRLSPVLCTRDLPEAELRAAVLDGELFAIDECFSPIDEIERMTHRAGALATLVPDGLIAEQRTAAWIYGALNRPPARHQFCANISARVRPASLARIIVREVVIDETEVVSYAGLAVTTPLRTAVDLARFSPSFTAAEHEILRALMRLGGFGADECAVALNRKRNLPGKRRALARIRTEV